MDRNISFSFHESEITGLILIESHLFSDYRGDYKKVYERSVYYKNGITQQFTETSEIFSDRGVLRGLHYQTEDSQAKLVHVIKGRVFDVAVDLRPNSGTFGKWKSFLLAEGDNQAVFIPEGFAHGFLVLDDQTIFVYQCSGTYSPAHCGGLMWNDPSLNINWPVSEVGKIILSDKDKHNLTLQEFQDRLPGRAQVAL